MDDKPFQAEAILTSISYTKDGGVRLGFSTNELDEASKVGIARYFQKFGYVLFKSNQYSVDDIPTEQAEDKNKTPSKRLRAALFVLWKQTGEKGDFDTYYRMCVERFISQVKIQLD